MTSARSKKTTTTEREDKDGVYEETRKGVYEEKDTKLGWGIFWLFLLFVLILAGFVISVEEEIFIPLTTPREEITVETVTTPITEIERLECKVAKYEILKEEVIAGEGRRIVIFNMQDEPWRFVVNATFTYKDRNTLTVPIQRVETVQKQIVIDVNQQQEVIFYPPLNTTSYNSLFVSILVTPEKRESCEVDIGTVPREKIETTTIRPQATYQVPYVVRTPLWYYLIKKMS